MSLVSSILGLIAVVLMKLLELVKDRRSKKHKDSESESQTKGKTDYGSIQKSMLNLWLYYCRVLYNYTAAANLKLHSVVATKTS